MTALISWFRSLSPRQQMIAPYLALTAATFLAYSNIYGNTFVFDDGLLITRNTLLHSWDTFGKLFTASTTDGAHIVGGFYRPVQIILYFFIYQVAGESEFAFHLLNISLHAANVALLYRLGRKLDFHPGAAFLAVLLWALHPLHTEAVTYMSSTADTLHSFFCLLGVLVALPDFSLRRILIALPIFLLGLLSKETAVVMPLLIMSCIYLKNPDRLALKTYLRTWPLWLLAIAFMSWRMTATGYDGPITYHRIYALPDYYNLRIYSEHFALRAYTFLATLPAYLALLIWPADLHMERSFTIYADFWLLPVMIGAGIFLAAAIMVLFVSRPKKLVPLRWGILWFALAHSPNTGLLVPINSLFLEHWMYLPTMGLFLGAGQSLFLYLKEKESKWLQNLAIGLTLVVALAFGIKTFIQNEVWRDPVTFYTHIFHYSSHSARAHNNLALAYMERHEYAKAIDEYHQAIAITDTYAETRHNLAVSLLNLPDSAHHVQEAIDNLNRAIEIDPNFYRAYIALSQVYAYLGDQDKAAAYSAKAKEILERSQ